MGTPYRYWRVSTISFPATSATIAFAGIEMRTAIDGSGSNLALTGSGTASASSTSSGSAANIFDGSNATTWTSAALTPTVGHWVQWDFGAGVTQDIQHFGLYAFTQAIPFTLALQGSNNLTTWETRAYVTSLPAGSMVYVRAQTFPQTAVVKPAQIIVPGRARTLPTSTRLSGATLKVQDVYSGGQGTISGHVKIRPSSGPDVPVSRHVILIDERANRIVRATWSRASDGHFEFTSIDSTRKYTPMAYDYAHGYRAVPADNVSTA